MMILQSKLVKNSYDAHNHMTKSNSMVCLVVKENSQVRSVEWISKIQG